MCCWFKSYFIFSPIYLKLLILAALSSFSIMACDQIKEPSSEVKTNNVAEEKSFPANDSAETAIEPTAAPVPKGFDINQVPVVNPQLGKFPYFSLIEGYQPLKDSPDNKDADFDRYEFFDGTKLITVEGQLTTINAHGTGSSAFQVMKTYESLIKNLGGVKVFEGKLWDMVDLKLKYRDTRHRPEWKTGAELGVYAVRLPDKEIWVETFIENHPYEKIKDDYYLTVVEKKNLDVKASLLSAEEMEKALAAEGHVALYINFDFDKADIKPDSQPIIDEIVKLLKENPDLNLTIEGHTDNVGKPDYNKQLSDKRAQAVMSAITAKDIEASRLKSVGYGQEKPIADNTTDEGRAKNRRVELVKME